MRLGKYEIEKLKYPLFLGNWLRLDFWEGQGIGFEITKYKYHKLACVWQLPYTPECRCSIKKCNKDYVAVEGADDLLMFWKAEKCLGRF